MTRLLIAASFALLAASCHKDEEPSVILPPGLPPGHPAAAPSVVPAGIPGHALKWTVPAAWKVEQPKSPMRKAQYSIPHAKADTEDGARRLHFGTGQGGTVDDNLTRWESQFVQADGKSSHDVAKVEKRDVNGVHVTIVQVQGTFAGAGMSGAPEAPKDHWALLGAIVETPASLWFFKLTGPAATLTDARPAFDSLVGSFKLE